MTARVAAATEFPRRGGRRDQGRSSRLDRSVCRAQYPRGELSGSCWWRPWLRGTPVVASDLPAFISVLGERPGGRVFNCGPRGPGSGDRRLDPVPGRVEGAGRARASRAGAFDWDRVGCDVVAVSRHRPLRLRLCDERARDPRDLPGPGAGGRLVSVLQPPGSTGCTRVEGAVSALDAGLVRRAEASLELANTGVLDPASCCWPRRPRMRWSARPSTWARTCSTVSISGRREDVESH